MVIQFFSWFICLNDGDDKVANYYGILMKMYAWNIVRMLKTKNDNKEISFNNKMGLKTMKDCRVKNVGERRRLIGQESILYTGKNNRRRTKKTNIRERWK